jgi:K(+)-stimulated pyrophosphate-energized sodium pump
VAAAVRQGAFAYLRRQFGVVAIVFVGLSVLLAGLSAIGVLSPFLPVAFLVGGFFSGLTAWLGMNTATIASCRTAEACRTSLNGGLRVSFRGGAVMGLVVVGFGLLYVCGWYWLLNWLYDHNVWSLADTLAREKLLVPFSAAMVSDPSCPLGAQFLQAKLSQITSLMVTFGMGAST